ncbi:MAG: hypothetical protein IJP54_07370 [Synergistaceae bacterium]|nr:hypothetical protein [Synergistaceae bacterium]
MKLKRTAVVILGLMLCVSECYALPARYDLRDYGRVSPVKNQGIPGRAGRSLLWEQWRAIT